MGYQVLEAGDAMDAVRLIVDRGGIDLLFTDVGLPGGVSGRALADAARSAQPGLRVLFTTGYARDNGSNSKAAVHCQAVQPGSIGGEGPGSHGRARQHDANQGGKLSSIPKARAMRLTPLRLGATSRDLALRP